MKTQWKRVSKSCSCPVCGKPDWCMISSDESAAICSRIESAKRAGNAGWVHRLQDKPYRRPQWRTTERRKQRRELSEIVEIAIGCQRTILPASILWLADELGVEPRALRSLSVGMNTEYRAFSFPMREPNGSICGIRYRGTNGSKYAEPGSRDGMFFDPDSLAGDYLAIVEGASDAAALLSIGFQSVVGRASCHANIGQLVQLCRRLQFRSVLIVPDADQKGWQGARLLAEQLIQRTRIAPDFLNLPPGIKDVRECVQSKKNADWLADQVGKLIQASPKQGAIRSDNNT